MATHGTSVWTSLGAVLFFCGSAAAVEQDLAPSNYLPVPATAPAAPTPNFLGLPFDVAFGIAFTSDYVSRGITNSAGHPAVQGYIEPSVGPMYFNVWASNVDFGADEFEGAEIDTAFGLRHEFGKFKADIGYVHYFYAPEDVS